MTFLDLRKIFSSQLKINILSGFIYVLLNILVQVLVYPIYLFFLSNEDYGIWLTLGAVLSFAQLGDLGVSNAIMKLVAEEIKQNNISAVRNYVTITLILLIISGIFFISLLMLFRHQLVSFFNFESDNFILAYNLLPFIGILSVYTYIVKLFNSTISGLGRMDISNGIEITVRVLNVLMATFFLYIGLNIKGLLLANILSCFINHILSIFMIWRIISQKILSLKGLRYSMVKRLFSYSLTILGGKLFHVFFSPLNKVLISRYVGVSSVPLYEIAMRVSMFFRSLFQFGLRALIPEISSLSSNICEKNMARIGNIYNKLMYGIIFICLPFFVVLGFFSPFIFKLWLGERYIDGLADVFRIFLIGTFFSLLACPGFYLLLGFGKVVKCFNAHFIQSVCNLLIVLIMLFLFDILTVYLMAWSVVISMFFTCMYVNFEKRVLFKSILKVL